MHSLKVLLVTYFKPLSSSEALFQGQGKCFFEGSIRFFQDCLIIDTKSLLKEGIYWKEAVLLA